MGLERLTPDELRRVRSLRAAKGKRAASLLTVSVVTLDVVVAGQPVRPETARRLRAALTKLAGG